MVKQAGTARDLAIDNLSVQAERLEKVVKNTVFLKPDAIQAHRIRQALFNMLNHLGDGEDAPACPPTRCCRPTGDKRFFAILDEMADMHAKKGADYGSKADFLANLRASEEFGIPAWVGAMIRCNDKMRRVKSYIEKGSLANESLEDSLQDGACYNILALILFREQKQKQEIDSHFAPSMDR